MSENQIKAFGAYKYWEASYRPLQKWWAWEMVGNPKLPRSMMIYVMKEIRAVGLQHLRAFMANYKAQNDTTRPH